MTTRKPRLITLHHHRDGSCGDAFQIRIERSQSQASIKKNIPLLSIMIRRQSRWAHKKLKLCRGSKAAVVSPKKKMIYEFFWQTAKVCGEARQFSANFCLIRSGTPSARACSRAPWASHMEATHVNMEKKKKLFGSEEQKCRVIVQLNSGSGIN